MMDAKRAYIDENIVSLLHHWSNTALWTGSLLLLSLCLLDYLITPEKFTLFLIYRLVASSLIFLLYLLNRKKISRMRHHFVTISAAVTASSAIALMIASFGGHQSIYFVGMILLIIYILALTPLNVKMTVVAAIIIYLIYLVPILLYDTITNRIFFINANAFIISVIFAVLVLRILMHQRFVNELSLQYDLDQQKKQLEVYSRQLEDMVQKRTQELQKSEQWHRALFENATDGIVVLDKNGIIINVNNKTCEMHGYTRDSLIGTSIWLLEAESNRDISLDRMKRLLDGESLVFEAVQQKKDGAPIPLEISSTAITIGEEQFVQSFYRDITEKKKLQEHLLQSQKMESVGVLAGGIAHDFNNILTAILGHTEIVRLFPSLDAKSLRSLQIIEDASRKAGAMITKLLGFARRTNVEILPINVNDVVNETCKLLERVLDKNITLQLELADHLPVIRGDFNQLEQVIMNLVVNAKDAMPQGGRVLLSTQCKEITSKTNDIPSYISKGAYVQLSVSDTGDGIPDHLLQKIFEPFFTTKERGKGTGLGLSMCYGAIMEHKGYITVQSQIGHGSTFSILLPVSRTAASTTNKKLPAPPKGTETILIVDDEDDILTAVQETLIANGYKVLTASDCVSGVEKFVKMQNDIALVITDMVMPKIDGKEFMRQLRAINPKIRLLAISGYMKYVAEKDDIKNTAWFLQKPFEYREFLSKVRQILDSPSHNPRRIDD